MSVTEMDGPLHQVVQSLYKVCIAMQPVAHLIVSDSLSEDSAVDFKLSPIDETIKFPPTPDSLPGQDIGTCHVKKSNDILTRPQELLCHIKALKLGMQHVEPFTNPSSDKPVVEQSALPPLSNAAVRKTIGTITSQIIRSLCSHSPRSPNYIAPDYDLQDNVPTSPANLPLLAVRELIAAEECDLANLHKLISLGAAFTDPKGPSGVEEANQAAVVSVLPYLLFEQVTKLGIALSDKAYLDLAHQLVAAGRAYPCLAVLKAKAKFARESREALKAELTATNALGITIPLAPAKATEEPTSPQQWDDEAYGIAMKVLAQPADLGKRRTSRAASMDQSFVRKAPSTTEAAHCHLPLPTTEPSSPTNRAVPLSVRIPDCPPPRYTEEPSTIEQGQDFSFSRWHQHLRRYELSRASASQAQIVDLDQAMMDVALTYGEYEYAWKIYEGMNTISRRTFHIAITLCSKAIGSTMNQRSSQGSDTCTDVEVRMWEARAWVIYHRFVLHLRKNPEHFQGRKMSQYSLDSSNYTQAPGLFSPSVGSQSPSRSSHQSSRMLPAFFLHEFIYIIAAATPPAQVLSQLQKLEPFLKYHSRDHYIATPLLRLYAKKLEEVNKTAARDVVREALDDANGGRNLNEMELASPMGSATSGEGSYLPSARTPSPTGPISPVAPPHRARRNSFSSLNASPDPQRGWTSATVAQKDLRLPQPSPRRRSKVHWLQSKFFSLSFNGPTTCADAASTNCGTGAQDAYLRTRQEIYKKAMDLYDNMMQLSSVTSSKDSQDYLPLCPVNRDIHTVILGMAKEMQDTTRCINVQLALQRNGCRPAPLRLSSTGRSGSSPGTDSVLRAPERALTAGCVH